VQYINLFDRGRGAFMIKRIDVVLVLYFLLFFSKDAYAYIEPGSFTVLIQGVMAILAGGIVVFRRYIVSIFSKLFRPNKKGKSEEKKKHR
jgi:hypothetical protein